MKASIKRIEYFLPEKKENNDKVDHEDGDAF